MLVDDIYGLVEGLIKFPFSQICVHSVALDIMSVLEKNGEPISDRLVKCLVAASAGDEEALEILKNRRTTP